MLHNHKCNNHFPIDLSAILQAASCALTLFLPSPRNWSCLLFLVTVTTAVIVSLSGEGGTAVNCTASGNLSSSSFFAFLGGSFTMSSRWGNRFLNTLHTVFRSWPESMKIAPIRDSNTSPRTFGTSTYLTSGGSTSLISRRLWWAAALLLLVPALSST